MGKFAQGIYQHMVPNSADSGILILLVFLSLSNNEMLWMDWFKNLEIYKILLYYNMWYIKDCAGVDSNLIFLWVSYYAFD